MFHLNKFKNKLMTKWILNKRRKTKKQNLMKVFNNSQLIKTTKLSMSPRQVVAGHMVKLNLMMRNMKKLEQKKLILMLKSSYFMVIQVILSQRDKLSEILLLESSKIYRQGTSLASKRQILFNILIGTKNFQAITPT